MLRLWLMCFFCYIFCVSGFSQDRGLIECGSGMDTVPAWTSSQVVRYVMENLTCGQRVKLLSLERGFWRVGIESKIAYVEARYIRADLGNESRDIQTDPPKKQPQFPAQVPTAPVHSALSTQDKNKLENKDILEMAALNLSDDVIIDKIHASVTTDFDTGLEGLRLLKMNNISDAVIRAMINAHLSAVHSSPDVAKPSSEAFPEEVGVYVVRDGKFIEFQREAYEIKTSGALRTLAKMYTFRKDHWEGRISGSMSPLRLSGPQEIVIKAPELADLSNYRLLKLDTKKNYRQFSYLTIPRGGFGKITLDTEKDDLPFGPSEQIAGRTWRIQLKLEKGEYAFYAPISGRERSPDLNKQQYRIYTFGVD